VGFLIVLANSSFTYLWLEKSKHAAIACATVLLAIAGIIFVSQPSASAVASSEPGGVVVAVQPDVPTKKMAGDLKQTQALLDRHLTLSADGLRSWEAKTMKTSNR
jgi:apolipoprotein N-acyltransferase